MTSKVKWGHWWDNNVMNFQKVVRNGHNEWQKNIVKSELTDSYGSSDSNTEAFIESSAKMLPDKR